jgi:hypothetical protein
MMFLLLYNFSLSIVSGLSIYKNTHVSAPSGYDVETYTTQAMIMDLIGWDLITSFLGGAIAGVFLAYGLKVPGDSAFVYSTFGTFYIVKASDAIAIFWDLAKAGSTPSEVKLAILFGVVIFTFVMAVALLSFIMQLVKGPWSGME